MRHLIAGLVVVLVLAAVSYFSLRGPSEPIPEVYASYTGRPEDYSGDKILLVAVYADWASVWRMTAQVLSELDPDKYDIQLIDANSNPEMVKSLGADIIPTVIVFQNGKETGKHPNLTSAEDLP